MMKRFIILIIFISFSCILQTNKATPRNFLMQAVLMQNKGFEYSYQDPSICYHEYASFENKFSDEKLPPNTYYSYDLVETNKILPIADFDLKPYYPRNSKANEILLTKDIIVAVTVDIDSTTGNILTAKVIDKKESDLGFQESAIQIIRRARFRLLGNIPKGIIVRQRIPVLFSSDYEYKDSLIK